MKHKLLSMLALAGAMFTSAGVWAQTELPDPVKPVAPVRSAFEGTWVTPTAGGSYYIYNVGAAQFLGCGRDWGTRTVATTDSIVSPTGTSIKHATNKNFVLPFNVESDGGDYLYFRSFKTDQTNIYVTALADGNASWYDGDAGRAAHWQLIPGNGNDFLLHDAMTDPYDADAYVDDDPDTEENEQDAVKSKYGLLAIDAVESSSYTWTDAWVGSKNGKSYKVAWKFVEATDDVAKSIRAWREESQDALDAEMKVYNNLLAIYNAKLTLRTTIAAAEAASISVTDAINIYNSETATEAEVLAANTALQLAITIQGATPPVDITSVLVNPDFEVGNINGWETNYVSGKQAQNIGYQGASYTNGEITISKFIESWLPGPATIGDGYLQQTIYGLPAGKYRLECDAIAVQQSNASATTTGAYLFIQAGTLESKTSMTSGNEAPEHFEVSFSNDGGKPLTFGMKTVSTSANWICADNFKLWYDGELTESPHYTQLKSYLSQVQDQYSNEGFGNAYLCADSLTALDNAIEAAGNISSTNTDDECDAAYAALDKALAGVLTSIKVYKSLLAYTTLNEEGSKLAFYEDATAENKWDELSKTLSGLQEDFDNAYEEGTWSDAEVTEHINSIIPTILNWVQEHPEALTEGNDLTLLLINADFSEGDYSAGWDAIDDEIQPGKDYGTIPGWTIASGNITQLHGSVIETYHRKFDFNQTIKNLPAGVYDISVQGFVRHDGTATDETIFYAGDLQTSLMLRSDQWSESPLYDNATMGDPCGGSNADQEIENSKGETVYVPNGMSGFYFWKLAENTGGETMDYTKWKEGDLYYTNHIKATLNEAGDFTIGMKSLGTNDWIIWSNFNIKYLGDASSIYAEMAEDDLTAVKRVLDNTLYPTIQAKSDLAEIEKIDYSTISTLEAYNAYKKPIDDLTAYIQEGTKLGAALHALISEYQEKDVTFDTSSFLAGSFAEYQSNLENQTSPSNDYLRSAPEVLAKEWVACAMSQADPTTFNNLDGIISSAKYTNAEGFTLNGWSMEKAEEVTITNYLANEGVAEVYNPSGEYKHYQTIQGLREGYYRITVDGYFRPGDMKQSDGREACVAIPSRAYLFAESGDETWKSPLKNILVGHDELEGVGSESTWTWGDPEQGDETLEYTPNNVAAANHYFNNVYNYDAEATNLSGEDTDQSVYRNVVNAYVGEDGILTIGISNHGFEPATNDWACFSNWTLSYMGTEAPDAVKGISVKGATAPAAIFTIDGRQASRLQRGMNIVRQTNGDVKKVLVK